MTIYIDVVFIENFLLNFIIILGTSIISKSKTSILRITISSLFGSAFAILGYFINLNFFIKLLISICMVCIAFKINKLLRLLKLLIFFYFISFAFGGISYMLIYYLGSYTLNVVILSIIIGLIIVLLFFKIINEKFQNTIYDIEIFYNGKNLKIKSMLDTGNLLKDPITNNDVMLVEKDEISKIVPKEFWDKINNVKKGNLLEKSNYDGFKITLIPYSSIGKENGILFGFKPDSVKIYSDFAITKKNIIIGIYDGKLSINNLFTSLISLDILK